MIAKLSSVALLAALSTAATAQTTAPKPATTTAKSGTTTVHHATSAIATAKPTTPPNIPKVVGIAKIAYALRYIDIVPGTGPLAENSVLGTSEADSRIKWY